MVVATRASTRRKSTIVDSTAIPWPTTSDRSSLASLSGSKQPEQLGKRQRKRPLSPHHSNKRIQPFSTDDQSCSLKRASQDDLTWQQRDLLRQQGANSNHRRSRSAVVVSSSLPILCVTSQGDLVLADTAAAQDLSKRKSARRSLPNGAASPSTLRSTA